jgi:hypothetical protein
MKVKIFSGENPLYIEDKINEFLEENINIKHVVQSEGANGEIAVTIFYVESIIQLQ